MKNVRQFGHLSGVIDFGILETGDPACYLVMVWIFFEKESRQIFIRNIYIDSKFWNRAKGWTLWKSLITYHSSDEKVRNNAQYTIGAILEDE